MNRLATTLVDKTKIFVATFALVMSFGLVLAPAVSAATCADNPAQPKCKVKDGVQGAGGTGEGNTATSFTDLIEDVINILLFIIGAVAVIMIIIGGIRYTTSNGDQGQVTSAKNTILYAVVGVVVAIMAYAIVNFVIANL